jgi:hypothetical protein
MDFIALIFLIFLLSMGVPPGKMREYYHLPGGFAMSRWLLPLAEYSFIIKVDTFEGGMLCQ